MPSSKVQDIVNHIAQTVDDFSASLPAVERRAFNSVLVELRALTVDGSGNIVQSLDNLRITNNVRFKLKQLFSKGEYKADVNMLDADFRQLTTMQTSYFANTFADFEKNKRLPKQLSQAAANSTIDTLTGAGVQANVVDKAVAIVTDGIRSGSSIADLNDNMREFMISSKGVDSKLASYSKQVVLDAISQNAANYTKIVTEDLGLEWFEYSGALIGTSRPFCRAMVEKRWVHISELGAISRGLIDGVQVSTAGMVAGTDAENVQVYRGGYNCGHLLTPVSASRVPPEVRAKFSEEEVPITAAQEEEITDFERDENLVDEDAALQEQAIEHYVKNKEELVDQYIEEFGNVANTDDARKLFAEQGYTGTNAAAFHEAASALNKVVVRELSMVGKNNQVTMFAGGAGSGKTTAISGLKKDIIAASDVVVDGTMSKYESSLKSVDRFLKAGKNVDINYVYREPEDAWVNGVIKRMKDNPKEGGRVVTLSHFLDNTKGSYSTVRTFLESGLDKQPGVTISVIDNSLGKGKTNFMDMQKFYGIEIDTEALRAKLLKRTKELLDAGEITAAQYEALIR